MNKSINTIKQASIKSPQILVVDNQWLADRFRYIVLALVLLLSALPLTAQQVQTIELNWATSAGKIDSSLWGVADYEIQSPENVSDEGYTQYMQKIDPALIRIHRSTLASKWTSAETETWDSAYIVECFNAAKLAYGDAKVIYNPIPKWPDWLSEENVANTEVENKIIELFASIARIVKNSDIRVDYWELFNERDNSYDDAGQMNSLYNFYNRAYDTIKTVLPEAKIGGLAFTHPSSTWISGFLSKCEGRYDFISWHNYSNGPDNKPNNYVLLTDRVASIELQAKGVINQLKSRNLQDKVETFLTEFNIQWSWDPIEERHANFAGAMFEACVINRLAYLGVSGVTVWHNKGNAYGLIDANNNMRATGILYSWGNRYLTGNRPTIVEQPGNDKIEVIATQNTNGNQSVLLINKQATSVSISVSSLAIPGESLRVLVIDEQSYMPYPISIVNDIIELAPMSATLVTNAPVSDIVKPSKPELSGFTQINSASIEISNLMDNASLAGFKFYLDNAFWGFYSNKSKLEIGGLEMATEYSFYAVACDEEGNESETSEVLVLTTKSDIIGPTVPGRFKVNDIGNNELELNWNASLDNSGVAGYVIVAQNQVVDTIETTSYIFNYTGIVGNLIIGVYAFDIFGNISDSAEKQLMVIGNVTDVTELEEAKFVCYPTLISKENPSFKVMNAQSKLFIIDLNGQQIQYTVMNVRNGLQDIRLKNVDPGVYLVTSINRNSKTIQKILIY